MTQQLTPEERARQLAALDRVRRRVLSIAFFTVAIHGVIGLVVVSEIVHGEGRGGDAVVLLFMSGVVAVIMVTVMLVILKRPLLPPIWQFVGLIPTIAGIVWIYG
ncbi:MAG: hypothetical protein QM621_01445 [Aeromicrobium sp.]|uniref:hypothetical protein n=1 Tax=Aeromicrobium sp. TaxID=1871063 RepID=UPI0039E6BC3D